MHIILLSHLEIVIFSGDIEKHERFSGWFCTSGNIYL